MRKLNSLLIAVLLCLGAVSVSAQSTVYFFIPSLGSYECNLKMNGNNIGDLRGSLKKTMDDSMFKTPYKVYEAAYKKCVVKEEGKTLFAVDYKFTNCTNMVVSEIAAEIQLNLSEGSVHYIRLAPKGISDLQFKELTEKEAQKLLNKYEKLADYNQE